MDQLTRVLDDRNASHVDVFNHVYNLRKCRSYMVQCPAQYVYIYRCLREHLKRKRVRRMVRNATEVRKSRCFMAIWNQRTYVI